MGQQLFIKDPPVNGAGGSRRMQSDCIYGVWEKLNKNIMPAAKGYSVFEITNTKNGRKHFLVTSTYNKENVLSGIRSYIDSKSVKGGAKAMATDIANSGKDYHEHFNVKEQGTGMSKEAAEKRRAELVTKAGEVYNQEIQVT